jgi:hypothetical protein
MEEIEKLYGVVSKEGLYTKSLDEFKAKYSDESSREKLYNVVSQKGLYTKTREEFNSKYFSEVKKKDDSQPTGATLQKVSPTQPTTKKSLLDGEGPKKQSVSATSNGAPKMKVFTGFTPEEQKSLQAKPVTDYMVNKTKEQLNPVVKRQRILESKKVLTPAEKQELQSIKTAKIEGDRYLTNKLMKGMTPRINQALEVSDDENKRIEAEYNQDASGGGWWQKTKEAASDITTGILQSLGSLADMHESNIKDLEIKPDSPLQKYNEEVIREVKDSKEVLTSEQFQQRVRDKYINEKKNNVVLSQLNQINDELPDDLRERLKLGTFDNLTNLTKENKDLLKVTKVLETSRDAVHDDFVELEKKMVELSKARQPIPDDLKIQYESIVKKYNEYSSQIKNNYDKYSKNSKDLGNFKQEYEVFNTFGNGYLNFGTKLVNSGETILADALDFGAYMYDMGSNLPGLEKYNKVISLGLHVGAKELREDVEYRSQFLRKTTEAVSVDDYVDKTVGFVADNLIPVIGLFFGGEVGIAGMAMTTAGSKYNQMVIEKEMGAKEGKDQYSTLQMATVPILWGATMVAPMATQLGAMRNAQRTMMAIERQSPALLEKTFMDKAIEFGTKYNLESIKLAKDLTVMRGLQQVTDNMILGKDIDYTQFKAGEIFKEAYGLHALNMAMPIVFGTITKPFFTNKEVKEMTESSNDIFSLGEKLKDSKLTQEEKGIIKNSINTLTEKMNTIVSSKIENITKLPTFISDKIFDGFAKSSELRAKALRIKNSENLSTREKKVALEGLEKEYRKNEADLIDLRTGNIIKTLSQEEQLKLKDIASRELLSESEGKDIKLSDEDITKRANINYIRDNAKKVEAEVKPARKGIEDQVSQPIELEVTPAKPVEEVKPTEEVTPKIESPIELKEGEELIDVKEDGKGRTHTYVSETTEKDGVKTTKFKFNRSDKSSEKRATTGVETDKVLDKYGYEISEGEIPEGTEITQIYEIREGKNSTGATVLFKNPETGGIFKGEVLLTPKTEAKPETTVAEKEAEVERLREEEIKEKQNVDPNDKAKQDEIYDKYDKLISPLLREIEGAKPVEEAKPTEEVKQKPLLDESIEKVDGIKDGEFIELPDGSKIEKVGDAFKWNRGENGTREISRGSAIKITNNKIAESRAGDNISLNAYDTETVKGEELNVGDVYIRDDKGTRYVYRLLSKPKVRARDTGSFWNADVEVLHIGKQPIEVLEQKLGDEIGEVYKSERRPGSNAVDTFKSPRKDIKSFGKVKKINNWEEVSKAKEIEAKAEVKPSEVEAKPTEAKVPETEVKPETKSRRRTKKETLEVTPKAETEKEIVSLPENEKELDKFLLEMQEKGIIKVEPC